MVNLFLPYFSSYERRKVKAADAKGGTHSSKFTFHTAGMNVASKHGREGSTKQIAMLSRAIYQVAQQDVIENCVKTVVSRIRLKRRISHQKPQILLKFKPPNYEA